MTRAVCRATTLALATLAAALLSLALFAGPALAADGGGSATQPSGFGSGQWDGMLVAAVAGVIVGATVFALSRPGDIGRVDAHHESPKGDQQMAT